MKSSPINRLQLYLNSTQMSLSTPRKDFSEVITSLALSCSFLALFCSGEQVSKSRLKWLPKDAFDALLELLPEKRLWLSWSELELSLLFSASPLVAGLREGGGCGEVGWEGSLGM